MVMLLRGISVSVGKVVGKAIVLQDMPEYSPEEKLQGNLEQAVRQMYGTVENLNDEMVLVSEKYAQAGKKVKAEMFRMQAVMLTDKIFTGSIEQNIRAGYSVPASVARASSEQQKALLSLNNPMLMERAQDLKDVSKRLIRRLTGCSDMDLSDLQEEAILVSDDLPPSVLINANDMVKGLIMAKGSQTSHVAILAANMGIPAVVGCGDVGGIKDGQTVFLNAVSGEIQSGLTEECIRKAMEECEKNREKCDLLNTLRGTVPATRDGTKINVFTNIIDASMTDKIIEYGADGVGLFRTEFLYMNRKTFPGEDEQFAIYQSVAKKLANRSVTIRTMDVGADKAADCLDLGHEANPALGYRAIRICIDRTEILKTQLCAALRAGASGNVKIMFPMIASVNELERALSVLEEAKRELRKRNLPFQEETPIGIMIETPSAAILAQKFIQKVDFFSIGSNDLTQYTLAADRLNGKVAYLYDHLNPAVLWLIQRTSDAANGCNKTCSVCGEMARDPAALPILIGMGIKNISVNLPSVLLVKKLIGLLDRDLLSELAEKAVCLDTAAQVRDLVRSSLPDQYWDWCS